MSVFKLLRSPVLLAATLVAAYTSYHYHVGGALPDFKSLEFIKVIILIVVSSYLISAVVKMRLFRTNPLSAAILSSSSVTSLTHSGSEFIPSSVWSKLPDLSIGALSSTGVIAIAGVAATLLILKSRAIHQIKTLISLSLTNYMVTGIM